jgi:hypothetical protein
MKEALTARRVKGPNLKPSKTTSSTNSAQEEEKSSGQVKVFSLNPSQQIKTQNDLPADQ